MDKIILCDCDGVLTDGKLNIDHTGTKMFKSFNTKDIRAIRELIANGWEFYIITADDWTGTEAFAEKVGAGFIYLRDKIKLPDFLKDKKFIAVGDDCWDISIMKLSAISYCPKDAIQFDFNVNRLTTNGGCGVIAELLTHLL